MEELIYLNIPHAERLELAKRSGRLLLSLAKQQCGNDQLAAAILDNNLVAEIIEGKHILPIKSQWLRALEAEVGGIDWYDPSLLFEVAVAFEGHIGGVISSRVQEELDNLERKARRY